jgi:hypothetical protein
LHLFALGAVAYDLGHLDRLRVVDRHVPGEAYFCRVVVWRSVGG